MKMFTSEQSLAAYNAAPTLIQKALSQDALVRFVKSLQPTYGLHVDTAGVVSGMIRDTLLGLLSPSEFFAGLQELQLSNELAQRITSDLNTKVFIPLHEKIITSDAENKKGSDSATAPVVDPVPVLTSAPAAAYVPPVAIPQAAPVVPPPVYVPPTPIVATPAPIPVQPIQQVQQQPAPVFTEVPAYVPPPMPPSVSEFTPVAAPAPISNIPLYSNPQPVAPIEPILMPASIPTPAPVSVSAPMPEPIAPVIPSYVPPAPQPMNAQDTANRDALHKIMKEYGIDPYREPIDDKNP